MVNIEIDGKKVQAENGQMVIEAADTAGISIPRFCYHKKLSIAANCRMCLVEVEKAAKPLPACATPVTDGMKVYTRSPKALSAQKGVMEFLLINHPLDCPICDQGGECELQDVALTYGKDVSRFTERKRVVPDKDIGPLIATEMTRCIHCTRCVRFGIEVAGIPELGATGRGEHMQIGTFVARSVDSEMSGNVIDLCPVGALTSKPFRYSARAWEMVQRDSIAPHDCIGSNLHVHLKGNKVMRVVPRDNEQVNETWISDRDRFSYQALASDQRLRTPMVKRDGQWQETDWATALEAVAGGLRAVKDRRGAEQIGALLSPSATTEELYLAQKLLRGLGCDNIDHRLRQQDCSDQAHAPLFPWLGQSIQDLEALDAALLIGSNVRKDQPIAAHRLRKATLNGARLMFLNPVDYDFHFPVAEKLIASPAAMVRELAAVVKALLHIAGVKAPEGLAGLLENVDTSERHLHIAERLNTADKSAVILGNYAQSHPRFADLRVLAGTLAQLSESRLGYLSEGGNAAGAHLAGALPHRAAGGAKLAQAGLSAAQMLAAPRKAYLLLGIDPELDCLDGAAARRALEGAELVVALSAFRSELLSAHADVLLPVTPFTETSGTFVNAEGRWQSFAGVAAPLDDARPAWKVLRVLGNLCDVAGFEYVTSEEVRDELRGLVGEAKPDNTVAWRCPGALGDGGEALVRVADVPIYAVDALVRRAQALQGTRDALAAAVYVNRRVAERLKLVPGELAVVTQGDARAALPVVIDERVADGCARIPAGVAGSEGLAASLAPLTLTMA